VLRKYRRYQGLKQKPPQTLQAIIMKFQFYIFILFILNVSCHDKLSDKSILSDTFTVHSSNLIEPIIFSEYKSDSLTIDLENINNNFSILLTIGDYKKEYDLNKLNIPTKTPELVWINKDYACMVTWWSQAQSRHVFIPIKRINEFIYFDKDIKKMDSVNNNIFYIDTYSPTVPNRFNSRTGFVA